MQEMTEIVHTLEGLRDAVWAANREEALEAATVLLLQIQEVFGHDVDFMRKLWPALSELKTCLDSGDYEKANAYVLALLAKCRSVAALLEKEERF
jgi:hypothetical protein